MSSKIRIRATAAIVLCCLLCMLWLAFFKPSVTPRDLRAHFAKREHAEVLNVARILEERQQLTPSDALKAGESAVRLQEFDRAVHFFQRITSDSSSYLDAQMASGEVFRQTGAISNSVKAFQNVLALQPDEPLAHSRLALLCMTTGIYQQAGFHLKRLLSLKRITQSELCWLAAPRLGLRTDSYLNMAFGSHPNDPLCQFGIANAHFRRGDIDQAWQHVQLVTDRSLRREAAVLSLKCRLRLSNDNPPKAQPIDITQQQSDCLEHADTEGLYALGQFLDSMSRDTEALRCFAMSIRCDDHAGALHSLVTRATEILSEHDRNVLRTRAGLLTELETILKSINPENVPDEAASQIAVVMQRLGRDEEAAAWRMLTNRDVSAPKSVNDFAECSAIAGSLLEQLEPPLVAATDSSSDATPSPPTSDAASAFDAISFVDRAAEVGLDFRYFESADAATAGRRMIEFTGGGVGAIDLDGDLWIDLYLGQGTAWPNSAATNDSDGVFRNLREKRFEEVSLPSGLLEDGFSQGVAIGDLNNDGFPDIVVANLTENQCWKNNGDGTFSNWPMPNLKPSWTTSVAIADVNLDGYADIFEVNYVEGPDFDSRICTTPAGPRVCSPTAFDPSTDRLLLNRGNSEFEDVTVACGVVEPGNGLGIVIAQLDDDAMPEIFVANDAMQNRLWDNEAEPGEQPHYVDRALERGLAFGGNGTAQACMGIAAADFDNSGTTDLFVTNFSGEPNSLYLIDSRGQAVDAALRSGIETVSIPMLGFGTQAIDPNLDGRADIFLTNGDIDDFTHEGRSFRMPPQLLQNISNGVFRESRSANSKDVRSSLFRGRGVARCDWNRDLQWDLVVSCLDDPAKLLTSERQSEQSVAFVRGVATTGQRDAVTLIATQPDWRQQQQMAGDGYMASNQRGLLLRANQTADIAWPHQPVSATVTLPSGEFIIIEGREATYWLPE